MSRGHREVTVVAGSRGAPPATPGLRVVTDCASVREHLLDYRVGRLEPAMRDLVRAHLDGCAACAHEAATEQVLTELLERQLPPYPAPFALKRRLAAQWAAPSLRPRRPRWWWLAPAMAASVATVVVGLMLMAVKIICR